MSTASSRPNVILICSDHHRADTLGCYGHPVCRTPNLDRLASQGVQFNRAFSQNPVCSPARACMMTGTNNRRNGVVRNGIPLTRDVPTIADILKAQGYRTAATGKTHLIPHNKGVGTAPHYGFDAIDPVEDSTVGPYLDWALETFPEHEGYIIGTLFNLPTDDAFWAGKRDLRDEYLEARRKYVEPHEISKTCNWGFCHYSPLPEAAHKNTWITDRSIAHVEGHQGEEPLLLWVGYVDPHNPFDPPGRFRDMYSPDDVVPPSRREGERDLWPPHTKALYEYFNTFTEQDWRTQRALFYGSVTFMDEQIGRLIETVERKLDMDNTIIVYTADHGDILGDHGINGKSAYHYDPCFRVPTIWRWDGRAKAGTRIDEIVEQTDMVPTLLDIARIESGAVMDGRSYAPALEGRELPDPRGHAYAASYAGGPEDPTPAPHTWARTIRTDRWRATFYPEAKHGELFDMLNDPAELYNLWYEPQYREVIEQHRRILCDRLILMDYPIAGLDYAV